MSLTRAWWPLTRSPVFKSDQWDGSNEQLIRHVCSIDCPMTSLHNRLMLVCLVISQEVIRTKTWLWLGRLNLDINYRLGFFVFVESPCAGRLWLNKQPIVSSWYGKIRFLLTSYRGMNGMISNTKSDNERFKMQKHNWLPFVLRFQLVNS